MLNVLFLDDEPDMGLVFSDSFSSPEIRIRTHTDPELAIVDASSNRPDIIFVDYRMPRISGTEVAEKMPAGVPIYAITGELLITNNSRFERVITKPYNNDEVQEIFRKTAAAKAKSEAKR